MEPKTTLPPKKDWIEYDTYEREIKTFGGGGAHVTLPGMHSGKIARIKVIGPKPFICKRCIEMITDPKLFTEQENMCAACLREEKALKENRCLGCGGPNPVKEYWAVCQKCWDKRTKEAEEYNKKLEQELKKGGKK